MTRRERLEARAAYVRATVEAMRNHVHDDECGCRRGGNEGSHLTTLDENRAEARAERRAYMRIASTVGFED